MQRERMPRPAVVLMLAASWCKAIVAERVRMGDTTKGEGPRSWGRCRGQTVQFQTREAQATPWPLLSLSVSISASHRCRGITLYCGVFNHGWSLHSDLRCS
jgi:hypothetical protein